MHFLTRAGYRSVLPLAAAFSLAGGPVVFAAHAQCQRKAAEEIARQRAAHCAESSDSSASGQTPEKAPQGSRDGSASFVAAGAKPADTQASAMPLCLAGCTMTDAGRQSLRGQVVDWTPVGAVSLHRPCFRAHAPPII